MNFNKSEENVYSSLCSLLEFVGLGYQGKFVNIGGTNIHYLEYGEGEPLLLLHGGGAGSGIFFNQIRFFSRFYRVVVPDHPCFGLSERIAYKKPINDSLRKYIISFMDKLGIRKTNVVGLSMGGQGLIASLLKYPERFIKVVLMDSAGLGKEFPLVFKLATIPILGKFLINSNTNRSNEMLIKNLEVQSTKFPGYDIYKEYAFNVTKVDNHSETLRKSLFSVTNIFGQKMVFKDEELASIQKKVLVIWGENDKIFPVKHGYRINKLVKNSSLELVKNTGHIALVEKSKKVNFLMRKFLLDLDIK